MKMTVTGLPNEIYVRDKWYPIKIQANGWMRVAINPKARYPDHVEGKNLGEVRRGIERYLDAKAEERQATKSRKAQLETAVTVDAYVGIRQVKVRGQHASSGEYLVTYQDDGEKGTVGGLMSIETDMGLYSAIAEQVKELSMKRYDLQHGYHEASREFEDEEVQVMYRDAEDDYKATWGGWTMTAPTVFELRDSLIERAVINKYPWSIQDDKPMLTRELDAPRRTHYLFMTQEQAQEYLDIEARFQALQEELQSVIVPFDYPTELERATARA